MTMNDFSTGEEDSRGPADQICCLIDDGERCREAAGNASYSKRIQKTVTQKKLKLVHDVTARHIYICDWHKGVIQSARTKRRRRDSDDEDMDDDVPDIDLNCLQLSTLRRYKKHFKIQTKPNLSKSQLAEVLSKHLKSTPVHEKETLTYFIYMVKSNSNRRDQKSEGS